MIFLISYVDTIIFIQSAYRHMEFLLGMHRIKTTSMN